MTAMEISIQALSHSVPENVTICYWIRFGHFKFKQIAHDSCQYSRVIQLFEIQNSVSGGAKDTCHSMFNMLPLARSEYCVTWYIQKTHISPI